MIGSSFADASQPVRNLCRNPKCDLDINGWGANGSSGTKTSTRFASGSWSNGPYCRLTWTVASPTLVPGLDLAGVSSQSGWGGQAIPATAACKPLTTYFAALFVRPSKTVQLRLQMQGILGGGGAGQSGNAGTSCPANVWTRLTCSWTTASNTAAIRLDIDHMDSTVTTWNVGDTLDICNAILVEGNDPGYYADGSTPGWAWTGTAGASESVGYPYTLESIAGRPAWSGSVAGNFTNVSPPPAALSARTLYVALDIQGTGDNYAPPLVVGSLTLTNGSFRFQTSNTGNNALSFRIDTASGTTNLSTPSIPGVRTIGRHVGMVQVNDGITSLRFSFDNATTITAAPTPGLGIPNGDVSLLNNSGNFTTLLGLQYFAYHDQDTAKRIMAWLARQYGGTVPAGY